MARLFLYNEEAASEMFVYDQKGTVRENTLIIQKEEAMNRKNDQVGQEQESKQPWEEPRLDFVEPKLTKHGDLKSLTTGFFGGFSPDPNEPG